MKCRVHRLPMMAGSGRRPAAPVRNRRGLSMLETSLALFLAGLAVMGIIGGLDRMKGGRMAQAEARLVSSAADYARALAGEDLNAALATLPAPPSARLVPRAELEAALPDRLPIETPAGRAISWGWYAPAAGELWVFAWTEGQRSDVGMPAAGPGVDRVGRVGNGRDGCPLNSWCGPNLRVDAAPVAAALGIDAPRPGEIVALRSLSVNRVNRSLLRSHPGPYGLSLMEADLEIDGRIVAAGIISDDNSAGAGAGLGEAVISGRLTVTGNTETVELDAGGAVTGGDLTVGGTISAFAVAGSRTAETADLETNGMTAGAVTATRIDVSCAGTATCGGTGNAGEIHVDQLGSGSPMQVTVDRLIADFITFTGSGRWLISHAANPPIDLQRLAAPTRPLRLDHLHVDGTLLVGECRGC